MLIAARKLARAGYKTGCFVIRYPRPQRSACASRWGWRRLSSSSTWPRRRQGRWPGSRCGAAGAVASAGRDRRALAISPPHAYLCDDGEYRAITRETIIRGLAGAITWTPDAITVRLEQPGAPRIAGALTLLIDEINATPPAMPGDTRPITYQLTPRPGI